MARLAMVAWSAGSSRAPACQPDHRVRLKSIGAVGMLVQVDTLEDLRTVAQLAGGLTILPASATDIAKALGIRHYPILISSHGIEQ